MEAAARVAKTQNAVRRTVRAVRRCIRSTFLSPTSTLRGNRHAVNVGLPRLSVSD